MFLVEAYTTVSLLGPCRANEFMNLFMYLMHFCLLLWLKLMMTLDSLVLTSLALSRFPTFKRVVEGERKKFTKLHQMPRVLFSTLILPSQCIRVFGEP